MHVTMALLGIRSNLPGFSGYYSEGVASIAGLVKKAGHEFNLLHLTRPIDPELLAGQIAQTRPDLVCFSRMTHTFSYLKTFARAIKQAMPHVPTLKRALKHTLSAPYLLVGRLFFNRQARVFQAGLMYRDSLRELKNSVTPEAVTSTSPAPAQLLLRQELQMVEPCG